MDPSIKVSCNSGLKNEHASLAIPAPIHMKNPELLGRLEHVKVESLSGPPLVFTAFDLNCSIIIVHTTVLILILIHRLMLEHIACAAREALSDSLAGWPRELRAGRQGASWAHPRERSVRAAHRSRERRGRLERQRARRDLDAAQTWRLRWRSLCPKRADAALALRLYSGAEGAVAAAVSLWPGALREWARDRALAQHYSVLSVVRPVELTPAGKVAPVSLGALSPKLDFKLLELALAGKRDEVRALMEQAALDHKEKREVLRILSMRAPPLVVALAHSSLIMFYKLLVQVLVYCMYSYDVQTKWLALATFPSSPNGSRSRRSIAPPTLSSTAPTAPATSSQQRKPIRLLTGKPSRVALPPRLSLCTHRINWLPIWGNRDTCIQYYTNINTLEYILYCILSLTIFEHIFELYPLYITSYLHTVYAF